MTTRTGKFWVTACAVLFTGTFLAENIYAQAMPALFQKHSMNRNRTDAPTVVEAATMDIDIEHNLATLIGNVVVDDQDIKITCNKMIIYLTDKPKEETSKVPAAKAPDKKNTETAKTSAAEAKEKAQNKQEEESDSTEGKQLQKIECYDDVVITRRGDAKKGEKDQIATSDFAVYNFAKEEIELTGRPELTTGTDRLNADKLVIDLKTNKIKIYQGVVTYYGDTKIPSQNGEKTPADNKTK